MLGIRFRPHHFLCTLGFEGKGYSESFVRNFTEIANRLRNTPDGDSTWIEVVDRTDSICSPCPNRRGDHCETENRIQGLDAAHAMILGLKPGDRITWGEAKERIKTRMSLREFHQACTPCPWKEAGLCEKALKKLLVTGSLLLSFFLPSSPSWASSIPLPGVEAIETRAETLRKKLIGKTKAPKAALELARASRLLDERKYAEAAAAALLAEKSSEFEDHGIALRSTAWILSAEEGLAAKKEVNWAKVESDAQKASDGWRRISGSHLYSPWWGDSTKEIARAELAQALARSHQGKVTSAARTYERAFQRAQLEKAGHFIRPLHLEDYAKICLKRKTSICLSWVTLFANQYSKNSAESKALAKHYPAIVEAGKPNFANSKITTGYKQKDADEEAFNSAFAFILDESYKDAIKAFEKFFEDFPRSAHRFRARYWIAYCHEKRDDPKDARPHYELLVRESPLTSYGLLAMHALNQEPEGRFKGSSPDFIDQDPQRTPIEAARLGRVSKLLAAKAEKLAAFDLRSIRARDTAPAPYLLWLASLGSVAKSHLTAFLIVSDLIARMDESVYTEDGLDLVFPVAEWPMIQKQASEIGVDPILVLSLMKQESAFQKEAGSSVGAVGYMQLMPFTASDVEPNVERRDLLDAETNIRIGTKYLKKMLDRYNGNVALALSAYNAGPTAASRWVREGRAARSFMEYVEQIPYRETRDYVGTIYRNYVWYQWRLNAQRIKGFEAFWPASVPAPKNDS